MLNLMAVLIEPLRVLVDRLVVQLAKRARLGPAAFEASNGGIYLSHSGRAVFLDQWTQLMHQKCYWQDAHWTYRKLIHRQAHGLALALSQKNRPFAPFSLEKISR